MTLDPWLLTAGIVLYLAAFPFVLFIINLSVFRPPAFRPDLPPPRVSILIPARNEIHNIEGVTQSALASRDCHLEVLVLDDHSSDGTGAAVRQMVQADARLKLLSSAPLPDGWAGKMFACHQLAAAAQGDWLLFLDADVRITPDAVRRLIDHARTAPRRPALVSGVPRQLTGTWLERLLVPLIDFLLLGFLPIPVMRRLPVPSLAAAVGQLVLVERAAYLSSGGHAAIRSTFHDGLNLPRQLRQRGHFTDLVDISALACCRMYVGARQTWNGLLKNAAEGLGSPRLIVPMTVVLLGGQVLPWILLGLSDGIARSLFLVAGLLGSLCRAMAAVRFRQPWTGVLLHPAGVAVLEVIQWLGFIRHLRGIRPEWKGRKAV